MSLSNLIYDYFDDREKANVLIAHQGARGGLFGVIFGSISLYLAQALAGRLALPFGLAALGIVLLWQIATLFVSTAILHLILDMGGARGNAKELFAQLGLSELVWIVAVPAILVCQCFPSGASWVRLVFVCVWLWSWTLKARGIRDAYGIGGGQAWLTLGLPYIAGFILIVVVVLLALVGLMTASMGSWGS